MQKSVSAIFQPPGSNSVSELPTQVPRKKVGLRGVLESPPYRKQQVIVLIKVKLTADVEAGAIDAIDGVSCLMENLAAKR